MRKTHLWTGLGVLGLLTLAYQNCAETGGGSPFTNLYSQNCSQNPGAPGCAGYGDSSKLQLVIDSGAGGLLNISKNSKEFTVEGPCSAAGFSRSTINYSVRDKGASSPRFSGSDSACEGGRFSLIVKIPDGATLTVGTDLILEAELVGLDSNDAPRPGNPTYSKDDLTLRIIDSIIAPVLDSRAKCTNTTDSGCGSNQWIQSNKPNYKYYLYSTTGTTIGLNQALVRGFCQKKTGNDLNVRLFLTETAVMTGATPVRHEIAGAVSCQDLPAGQVRPAGLNTAYNGYFEFATPILNQGAGGLNSRHYRITAEMTETPPGAGPQTVVSQTPLEIHLRFNNAAGGRGWTYPLGREALSLFKKALSFDMTASANAGEVGDLITANLPLRRILVDRFMKVSEVERNQGGLKVFLDGAIKNPAVVFSTTLFAIANGDRMCDLAVGGIPQLPDFQLGGSIKNEVNAGDSIATKNKKAMLRMASCLQYWHYRGALGRNDAGANDYFDKMLKVGLSHLPNGAGDGDDECPIFGSAPSYDRGVCGNMLYFYRSFSSLAAASSLYNTVDLTSKNNTGTAQLYQDKVYSMVAQFYLNYLLNGVTLHSSTANAGAVCGDIIQNEMAKKVMEKSQLGGGDTNLRPLVVLENNPPRTIPFATYTTSTTCGSVDAQGSYDVNR